MVGALSGSVQKKNMALSGVILRKSVSVLAAMNAHVITSLSPFFGRISGGSSSMSRFTVPSVRGGIWLGIWFFSVMIPLTFSSLAEISPSMKLSTLQMASTTNTNTYVAKYVSDVRSLLRQDCVIPSRPAAGRRARLDTNTMVGNGPINRAANNRKAEITLAGPLRWSSAGSASPASNSLRVASDVSIFSGAAGGGGSTIRAAAERVERSTKSRAACWIGGFFMPPDPVSESVNPKKATTNNVATAEMIGKTYRANATSALRIKPLPSVSSSAPHSQTLSNHSARKKIGRVTMLAPTPTPPRRSWILPISPAASYTVVSKITNCITPPPFRSVVPDGMTRRVEWPRTRERRGVSPPVEGPAPAG